MNIAFHAAGSLALLLSGLIGLELTWLSAGASVADLAEPVRAPVQPTAATTSQARSAEQSARLAATMLARPLFTPNRRPSSVAPVVAQAVPFPRLTGTVVSSSGKRAFFADAGKPRTVGESERIGVWTVQAIGAGSVTLAGPGETRELRVAYAANSPDPVKTAGASTVERPFWSNPCGRPHKKSLGGTAAVSKADDCRGVLAALTPVEAPARP